MLLASVLVLSIIACFLPWLKMDAAVVGEEPIKRDIYGYDYIVPLGAPYTAPVAILNVIGFILSGYSFKRIRRIRMLNVLAGLLILVGVATSFGYTTSVAFAVVLDKGGSFHAWGDYGIGLEALLGFLMIIAGALYYFRFPKPTEIVVPAVIVQLAGIVAILVGTVSTLWGVFGLTELLVEIRIKMSIYFFDGIEVDKVLSAQDFLIFSIVGIIVLLGGIAMTYISFKQRLNRVEKVKLGMLVFSMDFLTVYTAYLPIFLHLAKSTPLGWRILQTFFVIMFPFTVVTVTIIVLDYLVKKLVLTHF